jgi:CPA2 family monovalent cation:H+ antiporter-2
MHQSPLIATIVAGLVIAFVFGALAHRLKVSPIAGYLLAGIAVGPFTPGFVADARLAADLAEIGVILLMFGVGLHFSLRDLLSVRAIAIPGAIAQIFVATMLGTGLGWMMGWSAGAGLVFGLALSVASTVVLLRALQTADLVDTERGRIAVGWLIVEDLVMVLALVLIPAMAAAVKTGGGGWGTLIAPLASTLFTVTCFLVMMLLIGRRVIPVLLHWVVHRGSRELFRLAVLAIALGVAFGAALFFHVSFALGAFFAGMILGETPLSRRATEETLPLRDAFAVLFFVSVGMLFDPSVVIEQPLPLLGTVAIILVGKSLAAFLIVRAFRHPPRTALVIAASLAQIGEFSFILATLGTALDILPAEGRDLILAGALISILLNPLIFSLALGRQPRGEAEDMDEPSGPAAGRAGHVVLVGYGKIGKLVAAALMEIGRPVVIVEDQEDRAEEARGDGFEAIHGNAVEERTLERAGIASAGKLLIAVPEGFEAGGIYQQALALRPDLGIIVRAHSDAEVDHLKGLGAAHIVIGAREIATRMLTLCAR